VKKKSIPKGTAAWESPRRPAWHAPVSHQTRPDRTHRPDNGCGSAIDRAIHKRMPHKLTGRFLGEERDAVERQFPGPVRRQDRGHRRRDVLDVVDKQPGQTGDAARTLLALEDPGRSSIAFLEPAERQRPDMLDERREAMIRDAAGRREGEGALVLAEGVHDSIGDFDGIEIERTAMLGEQLRLGRRKRPQPPEAEMPDPTAERVGRGFVELCDPVKVQLVEIEVPAVLRELPGHGEREADDLVQVEMRGVVADDAFGRAGAQTPEHHLAFGRCRDRVERVIGERRPRCRNGPAKQGHELPGSVCVEMADPARVFP
jgi:hypothetical protein